MGDFTPYSTIAGLIGNGIALDWLPATERERIASYTKYEEIYWSHPQAFKLSLRGTDTEPIYVPNARTVVDTTAYYMMKGLELRPESDGPLLDALEKFLRRERFYSKFHTAKHSGVVRGDFILHLTADPKKPEGSRLSINSVDPAEYFPVYDDDDIDRITKVHLVTPYTDENGTEPRLRKLTYEYVTVSGQRRVKRTEGIYKLDQKWYGNSPTIYKIILPATLLPPEITTIPVYAFKNIDWQGQPYGSSELRGFERLLGSINQTLTDQDTALALTGLGVFATDGPPPDDPETGEPGDWEIAPASVMRVPSGAYFRRVEGITSVTPGLDHVKYLEESLFHSSGTSDIARGKVEVQVAESGIALAIRFSPTMAKLEQRDNNGVDVLRNLFFDWKMWTRVYEGVRLPDQEIEPVLGEKLPKDRRRMVDELNNMLDRNVISTRYYRERMRELGYTFPADDKIEAEIDAEIIRLREAKTPPELQATEDDEENKSNNKDRPNESGGTEVDKK